MAGLAQTFEDEFSTGIQRRGRSYFLGDTVRLKECAPGLLRASVKGGHVYDVCMRVQDGELLVSCTCKYFEEFGPCKHIYAAMLASGDADLLRGPDGSFPESMEADDELEMGEPLRARHATSSAHLVQPGNKSNQKPREPEWLELIAEARHMAGGPAIGGALKDREIWYAINVPATRREGEFIVDLEQRERKTTGEWGVRKPMRLRDSDIARLGDERDQRILCSIAGYDLGYSSDGAELHIPQPLVTQTVRAMCESGRCRVKLQEYNDRTEYLMRWDDGPAWELCIDVKREGRNFLVKGSLRRGDERRSLSEPMMLFAKSVVVFKDCVAKLEDFECFPLILLLRDRGALSVPEKQGDELLSQLFSFGGVPRLDVPAELRYEEVIAPPAGLLKIRKPDAHDRRADSFRAEAIFEYRGTTVPYSSTGNSFYDRAKRQLIHRDTEAETAALNTLIALGLRVNNDRYESRRHFWITQKKFPVFVRAAVAAGWRVEAEGALYRTPGKVELAVSSGIDWFDLNAKVDYGGTSIGLPALLAALKKGETMVRLGDGSFGLLPEEWLKKYGTIAMMGKAGDDAIRFKRSQAGFLDALLAAQPEAACDPGFMKVREELRSFEGVKPATPPDSFHGELRPYQQDGLGWFEFLRKFGFGGCLADDMGLGKTVQVLALLEQRRAKASKAGPVLVVVPKSLVSNWINEAARFTPQLKIFNQTGIERARRAAGFDNAHIVITTYGTLRRDIAWLKDVAFDYVILDEAQAIKNNATDSAKAARLLNGKHRLALSGTPVENHIGELWSLFEFLNPGMLGASQVLCAGGKDAGAEFGRQVLGRALRPFILRRTKAQVARDLPEKTEQTLYCELDAAQRKDYDDLKEHYRKALLDQLDEDELDSNKIMVLEALLRLRQAACHPGLIDKNRVGEMSAKLEMLLPQITEVMEEGHKALVFSQFTSMLAIVRRQLDAAGIKYEYLDGKTKDRAGAVEKFQTDESCKLFLISLKAGGLGLNLTAAEYVFLLDPWWNPAVEAQAIDRTHRIGQTRNVFAYRLIARDTVEERVLELQKSKRNLADAIINEDNSLIRNLTRQDLELLLS